MMLSRYPPVRAGMELACQRLSQMLAAREHRVTVLTEKILPDLPAEWNDAGVRVLRFRCIGRPPFSSAIYCLKTFWFLSRVRDSDILHAHMIAGPAMLALLIGKLQRKPVLVKMAGAGVMGDVSTSSQSLRGQIKLWIFRRWATDIVAISPRIEGEAKALMRSRGRIHLIPNGVDTTLFFPPDIDAKKAAKQKMGLPESYRVALYVGRWADAKGLEELLDAWEMGMRKPSFPWMLLMVIAGEFAPSARMRAQLDRVGDRIRIVINIVDLIPYYHASDLAILLSAGEGLSNFLLEAMACGIPTLTSEPAAVTGITSGIVLPDSKTPAAQCLEELQRLHEHPEELIERGSHVCQEVTERFSLSAVADAYETLYQTMIQKH
jgi:glycosyltransferase involved in cell wall biosynthesis